MVRRPSKDAIDPEDPMPHPTATPTTSRPHRRLRRAKRGVIAAYIHEISPRHRAVAPVPVAARLATPLGIERAR
jgi:hypothetical protein